MFFYHFNFHLHDYLKKKIFKDNILKFDPIWHDKVGDKKYNEKMYFIEDIFYRFCSVISIFLIQNIFLLKNKEFKKLVKVKLVLKFQV